MKVIDTFSAKIGQSGLPRPQVDYLELVFDFGIKDDKFAGDDLDKTVMIVGTYSYDLAKEYSINLEFGSLGENILFDFNPHDLAVGTRIKIDEAIIQITEKCTICNHLSVFDKKLPKLLKSCRGLYCKIEKSGMISKNSKVEILDENINEIAS
ncbi:MOSC domain-containing protein [Halarcobacter sp.]|uniref:MOSC domain-containing protein n=1 Tax=Halarcobacter sp. TaxID=2321133 RepID=UPI002AAB726D|nr:MOSC domain-containing protein [Halarcobacter sp.]